MSLSSWPGREGCFQDPMPACSLDLNYVENYLAMQFKLSFICLERYGLKLRTLNGRGPLVSSVFFNVLQMCESFYIEIAHLAYTWIVCTGKLGGKTVAQDFKCFLSLKLRHSSLVHAPVGSKGGGGGHGINPF